MYDDERDPERLDRLMRSGLRAHASRVRPWSDLIAGAREEARQRRRIRRGVAAAAVALVAVPGAIWATDGRAGPTTDDPADNRVATGPDRPGTTSETPDNRFSPDDERAIPAGWRVESYHNVQVRVPPWWGWGASPLKSPGSGAGAKSYVCGREVRNVPPGHWETSLGSSPDRPYVGRPVALSDVCVDGVEEAEPHVWFDSPLPVGIERLDGGLQRITVAAGGMRVTVAHPDLAELGLIIDSVTAGPADDNGCAARPTDIYEDQPGAADVLDLAAAAGPDDFGGMAVCVYHRTDLDAGVTYELLYSTAIDSDAERLFLQRLDESPPKTGVACDIGESQTVVLQPQVAASTPQLPVRLTSCDTGYRSVWKELTVGNVAPWAVDGVATYVDGGELHGPVADYFSPGSK